MQILIVLNVNSSTLSPPFSTIPLNFGKVSSPDHKRVVSSLYCNGLLWCFFLAVVLNLYQHKSKVLLRVWNSLECFGWNFGDWHFYKMHAHLVETMEYIFIYSFQKGHCATGLSYITRLMPVNHVYLLLFEILTLPVLIPDEEKKNQVNFYFHTSLWCLKWFYEGLKGFHKTFWGTKMKKEIKFYLDFYFNTTFRNSQDVNG